MSDKVTEQRVPRNWTNIPSCPLCKSKDRLRFNGKCQELLTKFRAAYEWHWSYWKASLQPAALPSEPAAKPEPPTFQHCSLHNVGGEEPEAGPSPKCPKCGLPQRLDKDPPVVVCVCAVPGCGRLEHSTVHTQYAIPGTYHTFTEAVAPEPKPEPPPSIESGEPFAQMWKREQSALRAFYALFGRLALTMVGEAMIEECLAAGISKIDALHAMERAQAEPASVEALSAIQKYGHHLSTCDIWRQSHNWRECTCGFAQFCAGCLKSKADGR